MPPCHRSPSTVGPISMPPPVAGAPRRSLCKSPDPLSRDDTAWVGSARVAQPKLDPRGEGGKHMPVGLAWSVRFADVGKWAPGRPRSERGGLAPTRDRCRRPGACRVIGKPRSILQRFEASAEVIGRMGFRGRRPRIAPGHAWGARESDAERYARAVPVSSRRHQSRVRRRPSSRSTLGA